MTAKTESMPVWSQVVINAAEFHAALKVITQFPAKKPEAYNVVQFILNPDVHVLSMCAASINTMARIEVGAFVNHVEPRDRRFEITAAAAKKLLGVKPDMSEDVAAQISLTVKKSEVVVKDESRTASDITEAIAYRIAPALPADVPAILGKVQEEMIEGVDASYRALLTPPQAGMLAAAGRVLEAEYLDPIGLDKHQHISRAYVNLNDVFEAYFYVPNGNPQQEELPLADADEAAGNPTRSLRVVEAKGTGGLA